MALHIQPSPETKAKLTAQKRNSTITALLVAILITILIGTILFLIALSPLFKNAENLVSYSPGSDIREEVSEPKASNVIKKKPSSPCS